MCGRYASSRRPEDLIEEFEIVHDRTEQVLEPDFNVAPTKEVYAVVERPPSRGSEEPPARQLRVLRWGLVPSWAKDPSIGNRMINARMETVAEKPAYKRAFAKRRCLLPADGYYEWQKDGDRKQPWYLTSRDRSPLAMAGLYEVWKAPDGAKLWTCTVITT
ncbi:SOS response-associated peptidase, partial [Nocardioides sp.]|uniref:SOS response-associated peptidase n=1 Tax=Nocardioides sp. TaxID=35761 RepID=UPI0031FF155A|nr:yedK [Nocardioides sp.]